MKLTKDEQQAVAFVAAVIVLGMGARWVRRPEAIFTDLAAVDAESLAIASAQVGAAEKRRRQPLADGERIAVNAVDANELDRLPGVGPSLARRIVAYRDSAGFFRSAEDLRAVRGFGPSMLEKNRTSLDFAVPRGAAPRYAGAGGPSPGGAVTVIDPNRATAAELEALPGVGPALAGRIVAYRDSAGAFRTLADLDRVPGIGPALLARLGPLLGLSP